MMSWWIVLIIGLGTTGLGYTAGRLHAGLRLRASTMIPCPGQRWHLRGCGEVMILPPSETAVAVTRRRYGVPLQIFEAIPNQEGVTRYRALDRFGLRGPMLKMGTHDFVAQAYRLSSDPSSLEQPFPTSFGAGLDTMPDKDHYTLSSTQAASPAGGTDEVTEP